MHRCESCGLPRIYRYGEFCANGMSCLICKHNSIIGIDLVFHTHNEDFEPSQMDMKEILSKLPESYESTKICEKAKMLSGHVIKSKKNKESGYVEHTIILSQNNPFKVFAFPTQNSKVAP